MRIRSIVLMIIILYLSVACKESCNKSIALNQDDVLRVNNKDSSYYFAKYLYDNFNLKIPNSLHYYIVIPNNGCRLCMDKAINQIELLGKKLDSSLVTIIVSNLGCINDSLFKNNVNCYFDSTDNISDLNLPIVNVTIIHTSKEKIDSINSLDATKSYFIQKLLVH